MSSSSKLEDLNLTSDEIDRFSKAFKDEKFRALLRDYAEEISSPENRKKYEQEIAMMEQERGVDVKFIHPQPGHALKTSLNGAQKCFVNICSNDIISKPVCKPGKAGDGKAGQLWSLPYSLAPGREDMGAKGERCMIYDVVFHPDTLYMAGKNERFKKMVDQTAIEAIQKQFNVKLDKKNTKTLKTNYKGAPHPTVIRKPLPGAREAEPSTEPSDEDPLQFPYPYGSDTNSAAGNGVKDSRNEEGNAKGKIKLDSDKPNKPTTPTHAIKYRTFVDFQDYRYSRDSAPSTRPRELVITIDLPLLKCAGDADLDVTENRFLLQSQKPAYRLDFPLPYPVNENQGTAAFIKARKQLVVTLPVLPAVPEASRQVVCEVQSESGDTVEEDQSDSNDTAGSRSGDTTPACDSQVHDNLTSPENKNQNTSELPAFPTGGLARAEGSDIKSLEDCPSHSEPRCPPFHLSQDDTSVTLLIDVKGIVSESFNSTLTATAYTVTFGGSEWEKASYSLVLQFPPACRLESSHSAPAGCEHVAPVCVGLSKSPHSVGLWQTFRFGITESDLQQEPGICYQSPNKYNIILDETPKAASVVMSNSSGNVNDKGSSSSALTQETGQEDHTHIADGLANSDTAITPGSQIANGKGPLLTNSSATVDPPAVPNTMDAATPREPVSVSKDSPPHDAALDTGTASKAQKGVRLEERLAVGDGSGLDEDDLPTEQKEGSEVCMSALPVLKETNRDGSVTIISNHTTCSAFSLQNSLLFELD
ncbi:KTU protein, partial [Polyodon spathula]|nr:KTU protein [Polyodon spathula]